MCQVFAFKVDVVDSKVTTDTCSRTIAHLRKNNPPSRKFADGCNVLSYLECNLAAGNQLPVCQVFVQHVDVVSNVPIVADCRTPAHSKKRANLRVGSLLIIITMEVTYFRIVTLTCLRPTRIASARVLKQRSIRRPLIAPPVSAAIAIP